MFTRRDVLRAAGLLGGRLSLGGLPGGCTCDVRVASVPGCGAATFEVTPTAALVSIHASGRSEATIRLAGFRGADIAPLGEMLVPLEPGADRATAVELENLEPDREYTYTVAVEGGELGPYRLRTAPSPESDAPFRFLFTADIATGRGCSIFETMAAAGADFWLSLGDFPYADASPGARTLTEYRAQHRRARLDAGPQALFAELPAFAIYDDHEVLDNWDGETRAADPDRVAAGLAAWDEWFPLRKAGDRRYRSWRWGRLAEFFMLDCRRFRAPNAAPDIEGKSMLGEEQRAWLLDGLEASSAVFKFVITSVPLDFGTTAADSWIGFTWERERILRAIAEKRISGTLFLSADQHWFASHHLAGGIIEFQAGPAASSPRAPHPARPEEVFRHVGYNFAEVTVSGGTAPRVDVRAIDPLGEAMYRETVTVGG